LYSLGSEESQKENKPRVPTSLSLVTALKYMIFLGRKHHADSGSTGSISFKEGDNLSANNPAFVGANSVKANEQQDAKTVVENGPAVSRVKALVNYFNSGAIGV
jgi:hypothetical protein